MWLPEDLEDTPLNSKQLRLHGAHPNLHTTSSKIVCSQSDIDFSIL